MIETDFVAAECQQEALHISLIVPVRDEATGIAAFLESLLNQSLPPAEIIIADGGSIDETRHIVRRFLGQHSHIKLVEDADAYPGRARNLAIEQAHTEWVAMTDAGTVMARDWLENLVREAEGADIVLGSYEPILPTFFKECAALAFVAPAMKVGSSYVRGPSTASMMIRKSVWESLGKFPEDLRACEDLLFFDRFTANSLAIRFAPRAIVHWQIPDGFAALFRRFRVYSFHTLKAGLGKRWHLAVARMYAVGVVFLLLAIIHHWAWILLPLLAVVARTHRTLSARRPSLKLHHQVGLPTYAMVAIILLCIDAALLKGAFDYLLRKRAGEAVERANSLAK